MYHLNCYFFTTQFFNDNIVLVKALFLQVSFFIDIFHEKQTLLTKNYTKVNLSHSIISIKKDLINLNNNVYWKEFKSLYSDQKVLCSIYEQNMNK